MILKKIFINFLKEQLYSYNQKISKIYTIDIRHLNILSNECLFDYKLDVNEIWQNIFLYINYNDLNQTILNADDIKLSQNGRYRIEPRILCKQDTYENRPDIFKKYNLHIISIKNGKYLLTKTNIYHILKYNDNNNIIKINKNIGSVLLNIGNSETSLLDNLRYSNMFETYYLFEKIEYGSLLNGRHRYTYKTKIGNKDFDICSVQFETDGCYETKNKILIIECKNKKVESFNIRQLYFPYRTIYETVKNKKEILSLFISKDNKNIINIWSFIFTNPYELTSIKCIKYDRYILH